MTKRICIIPAKGKSTRLKRKNILPLNGHPLIAHAIRKALSIPVFDEVVVSTEDTEIAEIAARYGASVPYLRPDELAVDPATIADVCVHMLNWMQSERSQYYDQMVLMLPTSPLVLKSDILGAIKNFEAAGSIGCLLGVCQTDQPPFSTQLMDDEGNLRPAFPDSPYAHMKSNECPPAYHSNGCVAVVDTEWLLRENSFYGDGTRGYPMPRLRSLDIDTREEYDLAVALHGMTTTMNDEGLFS